MILALVLAAAMQIFAPEQDSGYAEKKDSSSVVLSDSSKYNRYVTIDNIVILGNKITKNSIILREIDVKKGQLVYYKDLVEVLKEDQQRVNNLRLFNTVKITPVDLSPDTVIIVVEVSERWYIFPVPIFDLVDRNFNVWWEQQDRDLSRVNYGLRLYQQNFRGRNEKLKLTFQSGFTKKFGIDYSIPYIDKSQMHGLTVDADYSENKNIAYKTEDHVQIFIDSEELLRTSLNAGFRYVYRKSYQTFHYFGAKYFKHIISDTIASLNPNYFGSGRTKQEFIMLIYFIKNDARDVQAYPLKGSFLEASIYKSGIGIFSDLDQTEVRINYARYFDLNKNYYFSNYSAGYISLPAEQPYYNYSAIGYGSNVIRGYELYLIEGSRFLLNKSTLKKRILSIDETIGFVPIKQFRHFPLDIYFKTYLDWGYVKNFENYGDNIRFSNSYIVGGGAGFDLYTLYDMVIRLEYSVNKDMEHGFFFHMKREF